MKNNKEHPFVYICSPFSGDIENNTKNARRYSRFAVFNGCIPITPHLFFPQFMNDDEPAERNVAIEMDLALLLICSEVWVFGDRISRGMEIEIRQAADHNIKIRYFTNQCKEEIR